MNTPEVGPIHAIAHGYRFFYRTARGSEGCSCASTITIGLPRRLWTREQRMYVIRCLERERQAYLAGASIYVDAPDRDEPFPA